MAKEIESKHTSASKFFREINIKFHAPALRISPIDNPDASFDIFSQIQSRIPVFYYRANDQSKYIDVDKAFICLRYDPDNNFWHEESEHFDIEWRHDDTGLVLKVMTKPEPNEKTLTNFPDMIVTYSPNLDKRKLMVFGLNADIYQNFKISPLSSKIDRRQSLEPEITRAAQDVSFAESDTNIDISEIISTARTLSQLFDQAKSHPKRLGETTLNSTEIFTTHTFAKLVLGLKEFRLPLVKSIAHDRIKGVHYGILQIDRFIDGKSSPIFCKYALYDQGRFAQIEFNDVSSNNFLMFMDMLTSILQKHRVSK